MCVPPVPLTELQDLELIPAVFNYPAQLTGASVDERTFNSR